MWRQFDLPSKSNCWQNFAKRVTVTWSSPGYPLYNISMPRSAIRVFSILVLIVLAVFAPLIFSGYSELNKATHSSSYADAAQHYQYAAQRIPWRADLYELSGHAYYYAKDYVQADSAYQKAFFHHTFSADGWVAWGDVNYLNKDPQRATEIWEQALKQANPSDHLYSRLAQIYQSHDEPSRAVEYLQKYVSNHAEDASAHYRLGLLLALSDPNRALAELSNASQLDLQFGPAVETLTAALNLALVNDSASGRLIIIGR